MEFLMDLSLCFQESVSDAVSKRWRIFSYPVTSIIICWIFSKIENIGEYILSVNAIKKKRVPIDRVPSWYKITHPETVTAWARAVITQPNPLKITQLFLTSCCALRAFSKRWSSILISVFSLPNMRSTLRLVKTSEILPKYFSQKVLACFWFLWALFPSTHTQISAIGKNIRLIRVMPTLKYIPETIRLNVMITCGAIRSISLSHISHTASHARSMIFCFSPCSVLIW